MFRKLFKRKQSASVADNPSSDNEAKEWRPEIFQQLEDFADKLDRIQHNREGHYPFPLNGSDLIATIDRRQQLAWFLSGDYHGPRFVYMLSNGELVSRQNLYDTKVTPFKLRPEHEKTLIKVATKRLRGYLDIEDEQLHPLAPNAQSRRLREQIRNVR